MRSEAPAVAPYLRSQTQARLLAELLLHPEVGRSVTQLAELLEAPQSVISKEVHRLVEANVLADERVGRTRIVRANQEYRLWQPLTQILAATFGSVPVMTRLLTGVAGIDEAYIYGSWAARFLGETGGQPGDVDVLVVGTPDRAVLNEVTVAAERELGVPVQISRVSNKAWAQQREPFIRTVKQRPLVKLELTKETS